MQDQQTLFDISLYNDEFFEWHLKYAREYSIKTMEWFMRMYEPKSVVDFGCGIGSYLEAAFNGGANKIRGFDIGGENAQKYTPEFIRELITYIDCTTPIDCGQFDCVISFETAEHIEPSGTDMFIDNLCNAVNTPDGMILFTAAPPGQEGCGHINCQPKDFWIEKFAKRGFFEDQPTTFHLMGGWISLGCPNYIINNLIVLKK